MPYDICHALDVSSIRRPTPKRLYCNLNNYVPLLRGLNPMRIQSCSKDEASAQEDLARYKPNSTVASMKGKAMHYASANLKLFERKSMGLGRYELVRLVVEDVVKDRSERILSP